MKQLLLILILTSIILADSLSILNYGAVPNDSIDDTPAIKSAITAAVGVKKDVFIPAGRFFHKKFRIEGVTVRGLGDLSILHAPN
ncbi:MAG: hypothetical protein JNL74_18770, partial [Fibrobacteres bacterium]|nr:hypothetical protein [Fibrobacterota bacterium]